MDITEAGRQFSETWCAEEGHRLWVEEEPEALLASHRHMEGPWLVAKGLVVCLQVAEH